MATLSRDATADLSVMDAVIRRSILTMYIMDAREKQYLATNGDSAEISCMKPAMWTGRRAHPFAKSHTDAATMSQ